MLLRSIRKMELNLFEIFEFSKVIIQDTFDNNTNDNSKNARNNNNNN